MRLIDADAYSNVLREKEKFYKAHSQEDMIAGLFWARVFLGEQPTVYDSVKRGRWVVVVPGGWHGDGYYNTPKIECSECCKTPKPHKSVDYEHGGTIISYTWHTSEYCPNCGAKMDLG